MNILALDTSSSLCSVGLLYLNQYNQRSISISAESIPQAHAKRILHMIDQALKDTSLSFDRLDAIAYSQGPGSFTGLRIGSSVVQGISYVTKCPVVTVSTLAVLAQAAFEMYQQKRVFVAQDAFQGEIYWGEYELSRDHLMRVQGRDMLSVPCELSSSRLTDDWAYIGNAQQQYGDILNSRVGAKSWLPAVEPTATTTALLSLAEAQYTQGELSDAFSAVPHYLR